MNTQNLSFILFVVSGLMHVAFFILESYLFQKPEGYKYFKMTRVEHEPVKIWALNQGFYNLFLALGIFAGLYLKVDGLTYFCALAMIGAGLVLWFTARRMRRGAYVQMLPPLLALLLHYF